MTINGINYEYAQVASTRLLDVNRMAQQSALQEVIRVENLSIVPIAGLPSDILAYLDTTERSWHFEPQADFNKLVDADVVENEFIKKDNAVGRHKLYEMLGKSLEEINFESGHSYDIEVLTPAQAVAIIENLIRDKMKYEDLLNPAATEFTSTGYPDLAELKVTDSVRFEREVDKLEKSIDKMTASQLLESGWGVCRHFAGTASVLYDVLKEKQQGTLLNGTYLTYHNERYESQKAQAVVGNHAYNILVITHPAENDVSTSLSILDFTYGNKNYVTDYSWARISQACSFLSKYGEQLGISDVGTKVQSLVEQAIKKCEDDLQKIGFNKWIYFGRSNDYISLSNQLEQRTGESVLDKLLLIYEKNGKDRIDMLLASKLMYAGQPSLDLINQLSKVDYSVASFDQLKQLHELLSAEVNIWNSKYFDNFISNTDLPDNNEILFIGEFMRASVALQVIPDHESLQVIKSVLKLNEIRKMNIIPISLVSEFEKLLNNKS